MYAAPASSLSISPSLLTPSTYLPHLIDPIIPLRHPAPIHIPSATPACSIASPAVDAGSAAGTIVVPTTGTVISATAASRDLTVVRPFIVIVTNIASDAIMSLSVRVSDSPPPLPEVVRSVGDVPDEALPGSK